MPPCAYRLGVTSSRLEPSAHAIGAHRPRRRAPQPSPQQRPGRYEPYLDGLFTYCLSLVRDHDTAAALLGDVLAVADRRRGRGPAHEPGRKAWLYALARWACLRRLAEQRRARQGAHTGRPAAPEERPRVPAATAERRRAELALLAWPEAAGTSPEQRDALELAVRHGLAPREVAAVLGLDPLPARELLAAAACEVERTRAALAVVETCGCPTVARLAGDRRVLHSAVLRTELVRHVDDCPRCRRAAEHAGANGPWPGSAVTPDTLPLIPAPRTAARPAPRHTPRRGRASTPRFGPTGFPLDPKDHAARRDRLRARAVTTTVVATVVAAPVLALWAAYRGAPLTGEGRHGAPVSATETETGERLTGDAYDRYEHAGNADGKPAPRFTAGSRSPEVSVEVPAAGPRPSTTPAGHPGPGRLTVDAEPFAGTTRITLRASGGAPVRWSVWSDASWIRPSRTSGVLNPGQTLTLRIEVDAAREPSGPWRARIGVDPSGAVVTVEGRGTRPAPPPRTTPPPARPSTSPPSTPTPTPTPASPQTTPSATPTGASIPSPSGD
ncbi:hypothetical protein GCM10010232_62090 [Streptomyces amakusaensis]